MILCIVLMTDSHQLTLSPDSTYSTNIEVHCAFLQIFRLFGRRKYFRKLPLKNSMKNRKF